jgi:AraC-like DNA-binding protein
MPVRKLTAQVENDQELISEYHLLQILSGSTEEKTGKADFKSPFAAPNFRCVVIHLDQYQEDINRIKQELLKTALARLTPLAPCGGLIMDKSNLAILLNFTEPDIPGLEEALKDLWQKGWDEFGLSLSIGIGMETNADDVHLSCDTARRALSRRLMMGPGSLLFYEEKAEVVRGYFYPYDQEKIIFNHLRLNDEVQTLKALGDFVGEIRDKKDISVDNVIQAFNQLTGSVIKYLMDLRINSREIFSDELGLYHRLVEFEFIDEIQAFFNETLKKIILFQLRKDVQNTSHIKRILDYIDKNSDKEFDLNALSDHVGLSYSHVRRVFTDEMGENILNYVYKHKVEASKKLLLETAMTINEIVAKLGFYNKQSFYRFFKKFEGITPHEFRALEEGRQEEEGAVDEV